MTDSSKTTSEKSSSKSKSKSDGKSDSKSDSGSTPKDPSAGYVRGENQKPVTEAYRDNWQQVFGKKKKSAKKSGKKRR